MIDLDPNMLRRALIVAIAIFAFLLVTETDDSEEE